MKPKINLILAAAGAAVVVLTISIFVTKGADPFLQSFSPFLIGKPSELQPKELPECTKGSGPRVRFPTREALQLKVLDGIRKADEKTLIHLASCDFLLGPPDADSGAFNHPQNFMPLFLNAVKGLEWAEKGADYGTQYNLPAVDPQGAQELIFRIDNEMSGWYWAGYSSTHSTTVELMLTDGYSLGGEEEH